MPTAPDFDPAPEPEQCAAAAPVPVPVAGMAVMYWPTEADAARSAPPSSDPWVMWVCAVGGGGAARLGGFTSNGITARVPSAHGCATPTPGHWTPIRGGV